MSTANDAVPSAYAVMSCVGKKKWPLVHALKVPVESIALIL